MRMLLPSAGNNSTGRLFGAGHRYPRSVKLSDAPVAWTDPSAGQRALGGFSEPLRVVATGSRP
jgi:hypothetical protein